MEFVIIIISRQVWNRCWMIILLDETDFVIYHSQTFVLILEYANV